MGNTIGVYNVGIFHQQLRHRLATTKLYLRKLRHKLAQQMLNSLHAEVIYTFQFSNAEIARNQRCHSESRS